MKRLKTLTLLCFLGIFAKAQHVETTRIHACAKGAENRTVRLYVEDAITKFQWKTDEQQIDANGCFQLSCELMETHKSYLKIDFYQTYLYLEPGENYQIIFDSFDFRIDEKINPQKLDQYLSYRFETPDSNELNQLIWRFETMYDRFLTEHYRNGITPEKYEDFKQQVEQTFAYSGHQYFNIYKKFALADMERILNFVSPQNLFFLYLQDKPIPYNNTAFADFITEYYAAYFPQQIRYNQNVFTQQINRGEHLPAILDSLGRDTTLQNEKFREFVFLLGLREMYYNENFSQASVLKLLHAIRSTTKFHEHSILANSIAESLKLFELGVNQANFKFWETEKKMEFVFSNVPRYKYVLFVNGLCQSCNAEVRTLQTIAEKFKDTVDFFVVNCDYELNRCLRNKPKTLQNITYLHFHKDFEALEKLGISDYPTAIWIDPKNDIQSYFFQLPSQNAERVIRVLTRE